MRDRTRRSKGLPPKPLRAVGALRNSGERTPPLLLGSRNRLVTAIGQRSQHPVTAGDVPRARPPRSCRRCRRTAFCARQTRAARPSRAAAAATFRWRPLALNMLGGEQVDGSRTVSAIAGVVPGVARGAARRRRVMMTKTLTCSLVLFGLLLVQPVAGQSPPAERAQGTAAAPPPRATDALGRDSPQG